MATIRLPENYEHMEEKEHEGVEGTVYLYPHSHCNSSDRLTDEQLTYLSSLSNVGVVLSEAHPAYAPEIKYDVVFIPDELKIEL